MSLKKFAWFFAFVLNLVGCSDEKNPHFELSLSDSVSVTETTVKQGEPRCVVGSDLGCGKLNMITGTGQSIEQDDAFAKCTATSAGDLRVVVASASSENLSSAAATLTIHRNLRPQGFANCEGISPEAASPTGFKKSSCDVFVSFGGEIYAATTFEPCLVNITSNEPLQGKISCSGLRTAKKLLILNEASFGCELLTAAPGVSAEEDALHE